jgi:hypothetical protein
MIGHGYYRRKPKGLECCWIIRVKRWKCKACGKTVGAVPSFLLFFRHYLLAVIQEVIVRRYEMGSSWSGIVVWCSCEGVPALRSMQRWCVRFGEQAGEWLRMVEATLSAQQSSSAWLDPQGEALAMHSLPQALLGASLYLLAWAKGRWREVENFVLNDRLRFLWYWGNRQHALSRLA